MSLAVSAETKGFQSCVTFYKLELGYFSLVLRSDLPLTSWGMHLPTEVDDAEVANVCEVELGGAGQHLADVSGRQRQVGCVDKEQNGVHGLSRKLAHVDGHELRDRVGGELG